jgi:hypothetical protein
MARRERRNSRKKAQKAQKTMNKQVEGMFDDGERAVGGGHERGGSGEIAAKRRKNL